MSSTPASGALVASTNRRDFVGRCLVPCDRLRPLEPGIYAQAHISARFLRAPLLRHHQRSFQFGRRQQGPNRQDSIFRPPLRNSKYGD